MSIFILVAAVLTAAVLAIRAHYLEAAQRWQVYLYKPAATLLVLALALSLPAARSDYRYAVAAGLVLSTAGDVLLMLPRERFVAALASFLLAHVAYLYAFSLEVPLDPSSALAFPYFAAGGAVLAVIWGGLTPALRFAVSLYVVVIASMAGQAAARWQTLGGTPALAAAVGAGLFVVSDSSLAIDRFRARFAAARALTLASYWLAQLFIAASVAASL